MAVEGSLELLIDAQSIAEAEAQLRQALAIDKVTADLTGSLMRRGPRPNLPAGFESFFIKTIHSETLTVTKPLWTWGRNEAQKELARQSVEAAMARPAVTRLALAGLARGAALMLLFEERLLDVDYETLASLMEHQRVTDKRYREGLLAFFELAQADAQVADQERFIAERKGRIEGLRVNLRRIVRVSQLTPVQVSMNRLPEQPDVDLRDAIEMGLASRPEMAQADSLLRIQEAAIRLASHGRRPTVSVQASITDTNPGFASSPLSYDIVLAFQKPILDGGVKKGRVREARAGYEAARLSMEQLAESIAAEVADAYLQIDHMGERIGKAEMQERAGREQLRIARIRYEADIGLGREVIDAQAQVARAQTERANAELDLYLAIVDLRSAMGMLDLQEAPVE